MNTTFLKNQYNGFRLNGTLASRYTYKGILHCGDIQRRMLVNPDGDTPYWIVIDDCGARMSTFDERLAREIVPGEKYQVEGEVKIAKGATFLNLKKAEPFNGSTFAER
jgi:hypothetical protein